MQRCFLRYYFQGVTSGLHMIERKYKFRPDALCADYIDVLIVSTDDLADDGEAKACPFFIAPPGSVGFVKTIPDFRKILTGNAFSEILDGDEDKLFTDRDTDLDDTVIVAEFDGIVEQVIEDLLDLDEISIYRNASGRE